MKGLIIFCFLSLLVVSLNAQWKRLPSPEGGYINFVQYVENEIWAGTNGGMYKSLDDGETWTLNTDLPFQESFSDLKQYKDTLVLFATFIDTESFQYKYKIYYKTSKSSNWKAYYYNRDSSLYSSVISLRDFGLLAIDNSKKLLYYSNDFGKNWQTVPIPTQLNGGSNSYGLDGNRIYLIHYVGFTGDSIDYVYYSDDLGGNWNAAPDFLRKTHYHISYFEDNLMMLLSQTGDSIIVSNDFGKTFQNIKISIQNPQRIFKDGDGELNIVGKNNELLKSKGNGLHWTHFELSNIGMVNNFIKIKNQHTLFSTEYGVWKGDSVLTNFNSQNKGIEATDCQRLILSPRNEIYLISEARLFRTNKDSFRFEEINYIKGQVSFYNRINDIIFIGDTIAISTNNNIQVSFDRGMNWKILDIPLADPNAVFKSIAFYKGNLIVTNKGVYKTSNWGLDWEVIYDGWPPTDLEVSFDRLYLISNIGNFYRFFDDLTSWNFTFFIGASDNNNDFYPELFTIYKNIYAIHNGGDFASPYFKYMGISIDSGLNWKMLPHTTLLDYPNYNFAAPSLTGFKDLLFGSFSYKGVYYTNNQGNSWVSYNEGLPTIPSMESNNLIQVDNELFLATNTTGIWKRTIELNAVSGIVYEDKNNNGIRDSDELPYRNAIISAEPLGNYGVTDSKGQYAIYAKSFDDTLRATVDQAYTISNPLFYSVKNAGSNLDFGIYQLPDKKDLAVSITNTADIRPGFDNSFVITVKNIGSVKTNAEARMPIPSNIHFRYSNPVQNSIINDTLIWNLVDILPNSSLQIKIDITVDAGIKLNSLIKFETTLIVDNDLNNKNNYDSHEVKVLGSYDPNNKSVEPADNISPAQLLLDEPLVYTIRFENTGSYSAERITILDTLSQQLNPGSIKILASSHPFSWKLYDEGILEFKFDSIFLPSTKPESQGFIKFSILPKHGLSLGAELKNNAQIIFDFNSPIATNTVTTEIQEITVTSQYKDDGTLFIYPNPGRDEFIYSINLSKTESGSWKLLNMNGIVLQDGEYKSSGLKNSVSLKNIPNGLYQFIFESANRKIIKKIIVIK